MYLSNDNTFGVKTSPRSLRHLWCLQFPGDFMAINITGDQSHCWIAKGRTGKDWPVMKRYKCISQLNVQSNGYHWGLIISHHWLSWIFDWCSLSKELGHLQLLTDACCLLLSTGHAPKAEKVAGNTCSHPTSACPWSSVLREAHLQEKLRQCNKWSNWGGAGVWFYQLSCRCRPSVKGGTDR